MNCAKTVSRDASIAPGWPAPHDVTLSFLPAHCPPPNREKNVQASTLSPGSLVCEAAHLEPLPLLPTLHNLHLRKDTYLRGYQGSRFYLTKKKKKTTVYKKWFQKVKKDPEQPTKTAKARSKGER